MNNIVGLMIIYLMFLLIALFWYQLTQFKAEESMIMAAISVMVVIFSAGLAGNIQFAYGILGMIGAIGAFLFLLNKGKRKYSGRSFKDRTVYFFSPGIIMVTIVYSVSMLAFRRALYTYPDEVFQWGSSLKYMYYTHLLPYGSEFVGEDITMSFCTMFQYLWTGAFSYVESNGFVANFLLTMIPVMLPMKDKGWKQWKDVAIYTILVILAMNLLSYIKYYTLLQDYVLPMWTGGIIAWLLWEKEEKVNWLLLFPSLIVIGSMKSLVGPLFAIIILGLAGIKEFFFTEAWGEKKMSFRERVLKRRNVWFLFGIMAPFLINMIWSKVIASSVLNRTVGTAEKSVDGILSGVIQRAFVTLESTQVTMPFMSFFIFGVLFALSIGLFRNLIKDEKLRCRITLCFSLYVFGFFCYLLLMAYAYLYIFGVGDSLVVAGLERYLAYYMLVGVIPLCSPLFIKDERFYSEKWMKVIPIFLFIFMLFGTGGSFITKATSLGRTQESVWEDRMNVQKKVEMFHQLVQEEGQILIIGRLNGNIAKMFMYELGADYIWNKDTYMLESRDGTYTAYLDVSKYPELIKKLGYRYVWFQDLEEKKNEFKRLCHIYGIDSIEDGELYELVEEDGKYSLEYIGNTNENEVEEEM